MNDLHSASEQKRVVITGAAGAIGSATVEEFLNAGFEVAGLDRDPRVVGLFSGHYVGFRVDLTDEHLVRETMAAVRSLGSLSHVIGIAGGALPGEPETESDPASIDTDLFRRSIEANLTTQFLVLKHSLPLLREADGDRSITFTSSFNALTGCGLPAYSAAKAALIGMMHAITAPLGSEGIRVNVVAPGTVPTPRTERLWADVPGHFEELASTAALCRLAAPRDVARTFIAAATMLTHVTGQVIVVDGGQTVKRPMVHAQRRAA